MALNSVAPWVGAIPWPPRAAPCGDFNHVKNRKVDKIPREVAIIQ